MSRVYWQAFLTLGLLVVAVRIYDVRKFVVGSKGIIAEFKETNLKVSNIIKSKKTSDEKIKETQDLIDEVFRLGYKAGGGKPFTKIWNVKIRRNEKGEVRGIQYDEN